FVLRATKRPTWRRVLAVHSETHKDPARVFFLFQQSGYLRASLEFFRQLSIALHVAGFFAIARQTARCDNEKLPWIAQRRDWLFQTSASFQTGTIRRKLPKTEYH